MRPLPLCLAVLAACVPGLLFASVPQPGGGGLVDELARVLSFRDYNTRVVVLGVTVLGAASGLVGSFLLLRKRALLSDAVAHATLPGVAAAFIIMTLAGGSGKSLPLLLLGAAVTGVLGMLCAAAIPRLSRVKDDAALGIVLSVFFGAGIALSGVAAQLPGASAAGLNAFIYGKTASMLLADAAFIGGAALVIGIASLALFKEFGLICFDADFAGSQGWPVGALDVLLMSLVVGVTVIGLVAVGLILIVAMLVIPPAAARFWTNDLGAMAVVAAIVGAASGAVGAVLSALLANVPSGAVIVLVAAAFFAASLVLGTARGVLWATLRSRRLAARISVQHILRALFEWSEESGGGAVSFDALVAGRSWRPREVRRALHRARALGWVRDAGDARWALTPAGREEAAAVVRNHRLWELYLIEFAETAPSRVDRGADRIEHVLDGETIRELEGLVARGGELPASPHQLTREGTRA